MNWKTWGCLALAGLIGGCGGGGGGGGGGSNGTSPGGGSPPATDTTAATFTFGVNDAPESRTSTVMSEVLQNSGALLNYAQFTTDIVHRFATAKSPSTVTANCAYTGRITLQFNDADGNGRASAGDVITAVLDNCGVPVFSAALTGTVRVEIQSTSPTADLGFQARLLAVDGLKFGTWGGPNVIGMPAGTLQGSLAVAWTESATGAQLQALSSAEDDLRYTATYDGAQLTNPMRKIAVSRMLRYDTATVSSSVDFLYDAAPRNGSGGLLHIKTSQTFDGDLNVAPKQFKLDAQAANGYTMRAMRYPSTTAAPSPATQLLLPDGTATPVRMITWGTSLSLVQDPRKASGALSYTDQGGGYYVIAPWSDGRFMSDIDRACQQTVTAGINRYRADALFQRPVLAQPGLTQPGGLIKIQVGRAIASTGNDFQFKLTDAETVTSSNLPNWSVPTSVTRHGAAYEIRLAEPLRQGRQYSMTSSYDGVSWVGDRDLLDAQGQIVNHGSESFAGFYTDNVLVATATYSDQAVVSATSASRVRGQALLRDGQTVSSYRWEQLDGVPLRLSTPDAAETDVFLAAGGPQPVGDATLQLTIVDSLGTTDRIRVAVKAGNSVAQGAMLYTQSGSDLQSVIALGTGPGSFFYGPGAGTVSGRLPAADAGGTGTSFSVTPANGARLSVGTFNAVMSDSPGAQNGLISRAYCNTIGSPVTSSFQVLDVDYASDGTITRLAIDYVQQCQLGFHEYQRASYRYNSNLPLTP